MAKATKAQTKQVEQAKPVFNPEKRYRWTPEDTFELNGVEFAILLNQVLERKQKLIQELEVNNILEAKLKEAVEAGKAVELTDQK